MAEKLTVIIPCKDEETNIRGCIHSARKVANEIIVADSGSTDKTLRIVRGMDGVRVIQREYVHSGNFKNWAIPQATHRWVLILDADERIPAQLAAEILGLMQHGPRKDGYWIYRTSFFMGHRVRFSGWQNDRVLRLFERDLGRYHGDNDHAEVTVNTGRVSRLKNRMLHYSYWTYHDYFQRMQRYSTYQASKWHEQGRRINLLKLFFNFPLRFLQLYILRLGFLDGLVGLQVCTLTAMYSFSKQACLWQILHGRSPLQANRDVPDVLVADEAHVHHSVSPDTLAAATSVMDQAVNERDRRAVMDAGENIAPFPVHLLRALKLRRATGTTRRGASAVLLHQVRMPVSAADGTDIHRKSMDADQDEVNRGG